MIFIHNLLLIIFIRYNDMHTSKQTNRQLGDMEFGRRVALEKEVQKDAESLKQNNLLFDESGW